MKDLTSISKQTEKIMKYCRLCKTYHPEYDDNCPLCGAGLTEAQNKPDDGFDFAPYNSNEKKTDAKKLPEMFYCNIRTYACGFADCVGAFGIVCHYLYRACIGGIFWLVIGQFAFSQRICARYISARHFGYACLRCWYACISASFISRFPM